MNAPYRLDEVANDALLVNLKHLMGSSNELTAHLLAHLAEVDARGIYRERACATLWAYCVYELRLSEDEAQRRCRAARLARQFPLIFEMLADASIHLTGILLLAPYLTPENHVELLARARYRTKREIEKLIAEIAPHSDVPALIQPLGFGEHASMSRPRASWAAFVAGLAGPVRELDPGDDHGQAPTAATGHMARAAWSQSAAEGNPMAQEAAATVASVPDAATAERLCHPVSPPPSDDMQTEPQSGPLVQDRHPSREWPAPRQLMSMRYKVQFTADQAYVDLLEQARDLLKHQVPDRDLARVQRLAIEALLEKLTKRKYAATAASRAQVMTTTTREDAPQTPTNVAAPEPTPRALAVEGPPVLATAAPDSDHAARTLTAVASHEAMHSARTPTPAAIFDVAQAAPMARPTTDPDQAMARPTRATQRSGRHIPAAVKRAIWHRDAGRCSYVDARGQRCRETAGLEFHHRTPYVQGGAPDADNVTLHCRAHNGLAAERDFGRDFMERRKRGGPSGSHR